jgi:hypothetical protein
MADDMRLLMHPDIRHKITDEAIQGVSERDPSESNESVEVVTTKTTTTRRPAPPNAAFDDESDLGTVDERGSDAGSGSGSIDSGGSGESAMTASTVPKKRTVKSILAEKHELMFKMNRLMSRGGKQTRSMSASDSLDELRAEYERMQREIDTEKSVIFQRSVLMSFATGAECLNSKFDFAGIRLDGWSEAMNQDITSFDEVFEELHEKYGGKSMMPPEIKLVFMVASSAFMFHMSKSMFSGDAHMQDAMRDDPELAKAVATAVARTASKNKAAAPQKRGSASMFANILGSGGPGQGAPRGKPMTLPDDDSLDGIEQLFSDSEPGSESGASSVPSSSSSSRSGKSSRSSKRSGRKRDAKNEFILDA